MVVEDNSNIEGRKMEYCSYKPKVMRPDIIEKSAFLMGTMLRRPQSQKQTIPVLGLGM